MVRSAIGNELRGWSAVGAAACAVLRIVAATLTTISPICAREQEPGRALLTSQVRPVHWPLRKVHGVYGCSLVDRTKISSGLYCSTWPSMMMTATLVAASGAAVRQLLLKIVASSLRCTISAALSEAGAGLRTYSSME